MHQCSVEWWNSFCLITLFPVCVSLTSPQLMSTVFHWFISVFCFWLSFKSKLTVYHLFLKHTKYASFDISKLFQTIKLWLCSVSMLNCTSSLNVKISLDAPIASHPTQTFGYCNIGQFKYLNFQIFGYSVIYSSSDFIQSSQHAHQVYLSDST